jgi:16S rRNA (cytidine1402-2'-O)-methyltransferase
LSGILYVVATPLGNLEDLSVRASRTLREVDRVACEDTRHTRKLLTHIGSTVPTISYHEHNEAARAQELAGRLKAGENLALVSDAGTPLLSDPGYRLVSLCRREGIPVVSIPGPSALAAALSVAGLPTDRFVFLGFPAKRAGARRQQLQEADSIAATMIFYVSPHELERFLVEISRELPARTVFLIREMTKIFETSYYGPIEDVLAQIRQESPRGEYTLVIAGGEPADQAVAPSRQIDVAAYVHGLVQARGLTPRDAMRQAAHELSLPRREVYSLCISADLGQAAPPQEEE